MTSKQATMETTAGTKLTDGPICRPPMGSTKTVISIATPATTTRGVKKGERPGAGKAAAKKAASVAALGRGDDAF